VLLIIPPELAYGEDTLIFVIDILAVWPEVGMGVAIRVIHASTWTPAGRQGVNFENLRDAGDPVELARRYGTTGGAR